MGDVTSSRVIYFKIDPRMVRSRMVARLGKPGPSLIHAVPERRWTKRQIRTSNTPKMRRSRYHKYGNRPIPLPSDYFS